MNPYLVAAYAVIWMILLVYVFILGRKSKQLSEEVKRLKDLIDKMGK